MSGSLDSASRNVPLRRGSLVHERGNISYHAPNLARTESTTTVSARSYVVDALRAGRASMSARSDGSRAARTRATCG